MRGEHRHEPQWSDLKRSPSGGSSLGRQNDPDPAAIWGILLGLLRRECCSSTDRPAPYATGDPVRKAEGSASSNADGIQSQEFDPVYLKPEFDPVVAHCNHSVGDLAWSAIRPRLTQQMAYRVLHIVEN